MRAFVFQLQEPPIERLRTWNPVPWHIDGAWESNMPHRAQRFSTGLSHYVALCDRHDLRHGVAPHGPYAGLNPFPSGWQMHASGGPMLFDARQATSAARRPLSFATQRLLLPLLGHPLIETAFRAEPFQWPHIARFLVCAAIRTAKRTDWTDAINDELDAEQVDAWYRRYWPYEFEASEFLKHLTPEAPDDPAEFFRSMSEIMEREAWPGGAARPRTSALCSLIRRR